MRYSVPYTVLDFKYRGAVRFNARKRDAADCPCSQTAGLSGATLVMSVRSRPMDTRARPMVQHARRVPPAVWRVPQKPGFALSSLPIKRGLPSVAVSILRAGHHARAVPSAELY